MPQPHTDLVFCPILREWSEVAGSGFIPPDVQTIIDGHGHHLNLQTAEFQHFEPEAGTEAEATPEPQPEPQPEPGVKIIAPEEIPQPVPLDDDQLMDNWEQSS